MAFHLLDLLEKAATEAPENGCVFYGKLGSEVPVKRTYKELLDKVKSNASALLQQNICEKGRPVLIHLDNHYDYVEWYWSVLATGAIPAVATPLASDPIAAERHLRHLQEVLEQPKVLTAERLLKELSIVEGLDTETIEKVVRVETETRRITKDEHPPTPPLEVVQPVKYISPKPGHFIVRPGGKIVPLIPADELPDEIDFVDLHRSIKLEDTMGMLSLGLVAGQGGSYRVQESSKFDSLRSGLHTPPLDTDSEGSEAEATPASVNAGYSKSYDTPAALMLTSGSTGNAKAVVLEHAQMLASVKGKSTATKTSRQDIFFNWIGFDHVACLMEIHLHAIFTQSDQVHVPAVELLRNPVKFFDVIEEQKVTFAFAPNFFIASVVRAYSNLEAPRKIDLSSLRHVVSGGEANLVATAVEFSKLVEKLGGPSSILRTAFGMTETCAACHYNLQCPDYEIERQLPFCSVGLTNEPVLQRITSDDGTVLAAGENGNLEMSGSAVFKKYYNNPKATEESFTKDGWFKTGDKGAIDSLGNLVLGGRSKDSLIINGVKYFSHELETALEEAKIPGIVPSYLAVFSTFPTGSDSEEVVVVFLPSEEMMASDAEFVATINQISQTSMLYCSKKPIDTVPLTSELLPKSALGKLSRPKLKIAYEAGVFDTYRQQTKARISSFVKARRIAPSNETEKAIAKVFSKEFGIDDEEVGIEDSLVDMGIDSIQLIRFKNLVEEALSLTIQIPMISILRNPSIAGLSKELAKIQEGAGEYNPIVELQNGPGRPPIFFIHPGLGEILIFLNLSKYFADRAVYAIRAPGFNPGEKMFSSLDHMTDTYVQAIINTQPTGPYILCGYSFGGMIAFEIAKKLEGLNLEVRFCASFNLPPNISFRMKELDWTETILTLVYFLGFISEDYAVKESEALHKLSEEEVLSWVMARAPEERLRELDLNAEKLMHWATLSVNLHGLAHDYEPKGKVSKLDVFYAVPLATVGTDKNGWLNDHLKKWDGFVGSEVGYWECEGNHYTMMDGDNVFGLQKKLKEAMARRGVL